MTLKKFLLFFQIFVTFEKRYLVESAVAPPPWADPNVNPCAVQPRGWQLLFWPPDGKCYKIFKMGYPCPDDMELSPAATTSGVREFSAECRCPPKTAQSKQDGHCYELFKAAPCRNGQYFTPDKRNHTESELKKRHWGTCKDIPKCKNSDDIFWPQNGRCYEKLTKGPCTKGHLITSNSDGLAVCACNHKTDMIDYYYGGYGCFQHFTKGPCKEKGHLFLPDKTCNCYDELPHFHDLTRQCFEIGEAVKDAWERLRRCYTNALHRRRHKKHSKRIFPWKFEKEMSFLLPFLEVRKSKFDHLYGTYDENQDTQFEDELHIKEDIENGDDDVQNNLVEKLSTHFMDQTDVNGSKKCDITVKRENPDDTSTEAQRLNDTYHPFEKSLYQQMCSIPSPSFDGLDETDMFYLSMSRMTKRLPKLAQAKIKLVLSQAVLEAEIKHEKGDSESEIRT